MQPSSAHGSCLCGAIRFSVTLPTKWVAHCHCTRCQRAHGAPFVTWVGCDAAMVAIDDKQGLLHWYVADEGGSRGSCGHCASPMFFKSPQWHGEVHIARTLFLEPIDREPQAHVFYETHVDWVTPADSLPRKPSPA